MGYDIQSELISHIPEIERIGFIERKNGELRATILVLKINEYNRLRDVIKCATDELKSANGKVFEYFISTKKSACPEASQIRLRTVTLL